MINRTNHSDIKNLRVLLFDIDGTLLVATRRSLYKQHVRQSLLDIFGVEGKIMEIPFGGKTDLQIVWEALETEGFSFTTVESALAEIEQRFIKIVRDLEVEGPVFQACAGAAELLEALHQHPRYLLSIVTGNVAAMAYEKLASIGLYDYFHHPGASGSDNVDRLELPGIAAKRIANSLQIEQLEPQQFIVIGDTPRDIACARHFGAQVIAVANGEYSPDALTSAQPDHILANLTATSDIIALLNDL